MASISTGLALLIGGTLSAGASVASGVLGSDAASSAANEQVASEEQGLQFQQNVWNQEQQNAAPYLAAGSTSIGNLMTELSNGKFNLPSAPAFSGTFTPPTLAQAEQTPGFQFTEQQGDKGILEGAGAAGGAISGGTLKALDQYNTGLADNTYNNVFNQALQTYGAGLSGYQANLAGYQANLANLAQQFSEALAPAQLGANAVAGINNTGQSVATNVGNLMGNIGNSQAAGTVGSTNALTNSLTSLGSNATSLLLLPSILGALNPTSPTVSNTPNTNNGNISTAAFNALTGAGPG